MSICICLSSGGVRLLILYRRLGENGGFEESPPREQLVEAFNFNPIRSLTGSVGQLFAPRLEGQWITSLGCTHSHNGTGFLLLVLSRYIGDPNMIDQWPCPRLTPTMGSFTRLCDNDVKSRL